MSCGKKNRPINLSGLDALEWYKEHRCQIDSETNCWRWFDGELAHVMYQRVRYTPVKLMLMLSGVPMPNTEYSLANPEFAGLYIVRKRTCSFSDCIEPLHLEFYSKEELRDQILAGAFWQPDTIFKWEEQEWEFTYDDYDDEVLDLKSVDLVEVFTEPVYVCFIGNLRCLVGFIDENQLGYYAAVELISPGLNSYPVGYGEFENLEDARKCCEAIVKADKAEIARLEQIANPITSSDDLDWDEVEFYKNESLWILGIRQDALDKAGCVGQDCLPDRGVQGGE